MVFFFFKQKTAYEMRISDRSSDVCSSDLAAQARIAIVARMQRAQNVRLAERQEPIARLTAALQMLSRRPTATALVQPGSISDLVHLGAVLASVLPVTQGIGRASRRERVCYV